MGEGGTKEEKTWKRDRSWAENGTYHEKGGRQVQGWSLRTERSWEMNQSDKGPEGNEEVCSTTEVQYAEKNGLLSWDVTELADGGEWPSLMTEFEWFVPVHCDGCKFSCWYSHSFKCDEQLSLPYECGLNVYSGVKVPIRLITRFWSQLSLLTSHINCVTNDVITTKAFLTTAKFLSKSIFK